MSNTSTIFYNTVSKANPEEIKEKGSKFIGYAVHVSTKEEVKTVLEEWRNEHSGANHVCYAYRLGMEGEDYRYSDDGEPSNSAGAPIYGQLLAFDLTYTLIGVVRYFGGTKLGVGGLKSAYKLAAKAVLEKAEITQKEVHQHLELLMSYEDMPGVMTYLKRQRMEILETEMTDKCRLVVETSVEDDGKDIIAQLFECKSLEINLLGIY